MARVARRHPHSSIMRAASGGFLCVVTLFVTAVVQLDAQATRYQVVDLGVLTPSDINERHQLAIKEHTTTTSTGAPIRTPYAAVWDAGHVRELSMPDPYVSAQATSINNGQQVAGMLIHEGVCRTPGCTPPARDAVIWQPDGSIAFLPGLPEIGDRAASRYHQAQGINSLGDVAGFAGDGRDTSRGGWRKAVLWRDGQIIELGPGAADDGLVGVATNLNDVGDVVGWGHLTPGVSRGPEHAFLWSGTMMDLGAFGDPALDSYAYDVNDLRQVVGMSFAPGFRRRPFIWQGTMMDLGTLPEHEDGAANAINRWGDIVGLSYTNLSGAPARAVIWRHGVITDLNTLIPSDSGWVLNEAFDINDEGRIIGRGTFNNTGRYFYLDPVDATPPAIVASVSSASNAAGWHNADVTVSWLVEDQESGIAASHGCEARTVITDTAGVTVSCEATNGAGVATTESVTIRLDKTPPAIACNSNPGFLWPANHKLVPVSADVVVSDDLSGPGTYSLIAVTSSEGDDGPGGGDTGGDIQGFDVGTPDRAGWLRAERSGGGIGRIYLLRYTATDIAGNVAACDAAVTVPHAITISLLFSRR